MGLLGDVGAAGVESDSGVTGPVEGDSEGSAAREGNGEGSIVGGDGFGSGVVSSSDGNAAGAEVVGAGLGDADGSEVVGAGVGAGVGSVTVGLNDARVGPVEGVKVGNTVVDDWVGPGVGRPEGAGVGLNDARVGPVEGVRVGDTVVDDWVGPRVGGDTTEARVGAPVAHASSWTIGPNLNCSGTVIAVALPWSTIVSVGERSIASFSILFSMSCGHRDDQYFLNASLSSFPTRQNAL